jgi:hypothetical protein
MNNSDNEPPRDKKFDSPRKRYKSNIFLEYAAEEDLASCWQDDPKSTGRDDIIRFWEGLLEVADAVSRIHEIRPRETNEIFQGSNFLHFTQTTNYPQLTSLVDGTKI